MEIRLVQKSVLEVFEGDKILTSTIVGNDMPLGKLHDCNMLLKGWTIDRMVSAQKEEKEMSVEKQSQENEPCADECAKEG